MSDVREIVHYEVLECPKVTYWKPALQFTRLIQQQNTTLALYKSQIKRKYRLEILILTSL